MGADDDGLRISSDQGIPAVHKHPKVLQAGPNSTFITGVEGDDFDERFDVPILLLHRSHPFPLPPTLHLRNILDRNSYGQAAKAIVDSCQHARAHLCR